MKVRTHINQSQTETNRVSIKIGYIEYVISNDGEKLKITKYDRDREASVSLESIDFNQLQIR